MKTPVKKGTLTHLINNLIQHMDGSEADPDQLWYAIRGTVNPELLISNLAEVLRMPAEEMENLLVLNGFGDLVAQKKLLTPKSSLSTDHYSSYKIAALEPTSPFPDIFSIEFSPRLSAVIELSPSQQKAISLLLDVITQSADSDTFLTLYRSNVLEYYNQFLEYDAKSINQLLAESFNNGYPHYIITTGIGADELFCHYLAYLNNANPNSRSKWLIIDSTRRLVNLPADITIENSLFIEVSRSGKTEETIKIHEYTPRDAKRIVVTNSGPLHEIGNRDGNLVLSLPGHVPGRFGRNKTPILLTPMYVANMDTKRFWEVIDSAIKQFDLKSSSSLPIQIAQFIFLYQQKNNINHIYLGCNDDVYSMSADEMLQFWNEGVNKNENDIGMSKYFGLLRDSHATIEGLLANHKTKLAIFLFRGNFDNGVLPPLTSREIDPINREHRGLIFGDDEVILAEANYQRFSELMPTIRITMHGNYSIDQAAILGQLWADTTFCYSKMINVDPGSNPEVKFVRDRSTKLLADYAKSQKSI